MTGFLMPSSSRQAAGGRLDPRSLRRWLAILGVTASLALISACGDDGQTVALTLEPTVADGSVVVAGTTDLPDRTLIAYEVTHPGDPTLFADGFARVGGGSYSASVPVGDWPAGEVTVWAAFQTVLGTSTDQPAGVIERYGRMGEHLTGSNVSQAGDVKRVELEETVTLP